MARAYWLLEQIIFRGCSQSPKCLLFLAIVGGPITRKCKVYNNSVYTDGCLSLYPLLNAIFQFMCYSIGDYCIQKEITTTEAPVLNTRLRDTSRTWLCAHSELGESLP